MPSRKTGSILITGATGQVGYELSREMAVLGDVVSPDRNALNLESGDSIRTIVRDLRPSLIVNAAAYTAVDKAESEVDLAFRLNRDAPAILAEEARRCNAALIHYSTDYVFDGSRIGAYMEEDQTNPLSVYGKSKLAGEEAVRNAGGSWIILRCSWVYSLRGVNFLRTMLRLANERDKLRIVNDQFGAPTWARPIAEATADIVSSAQKCGDFFQGMAENSGVYHFSAAGVTTWYGFAKAIFESGASDKAPEIGPITTADYPTPALRPKNSVLDNRKIAARFGIVAASWQQQLAHCLAERKCAVM